MFTRSAPVPAALALLPAVAIATPAMVAPATVHGRAGWLGLPLLPAFAVVVAGVILLIVVAAEITGAQGVLPIGGTDRSISRRARLALASGQTDSPTHTAAPGGLR